ncbi:MAG: 1-deoxy-D-xylulose-5-phosphate reductoisomerase [Lachnospiraceae bacterium]|nr:1-deoxy-D-xylulose-5-phosphate reductoisomerase [Lachnospiraceae bacterium]
MKKIAILGSTGSIGTQTLQIVRNNPDLKVVAISGNQNIDLLAQQILEFSPKLVCVYDENRIDLLKKKVRELSPETDPFADLSVTSGMEGLIKVATFEEAKIVVTAIVGMVGIRPTMEAIKAKKDIALANKETLVCAGERIMEEARKQDVHIYPVDSEHSAIFQSMNGEPRGSIDKIILTASGGPFRGYTREQLEQVTLEDALKHPNWSMGKKVTIDSSTLANKGLEVMEAKWLFDVEPDQIEVVIQPQSILHSAVQYNDGAVIAQMGVPEMVLPIQYALFYPERRFLPGKRINFFELGQITFEKPDMETFGALKLAYEAIRTGGSMPTVFNAANEKAVADFLKGKIRYLDIEETIRKAMQEHVLIEHPSLEEIIRIGEEIIHS